MGRDPSRAEGTRAGPVRVDGDAGVYRDLSGRLLLCMEEGRPGLGRNRRGQEERLMAFATPITEIEQVKNHPAVARLLGWKDSAIQSVKFDRDEMTIYVDRSDIREACALLRDDPECPFNFLSDVTCVDW